MPKKMPWEEIDGPLGPPQAKQKALPAYLAGYKATVVEALQESAKRLAEIDRAVLADHMFDHICPVDDCCTSQEKRERRQAKAAFLAAITNNDAEEVSMGGPGPNGGDCANLGTTSQWDCAMAGCGDCEVKFRLQNENSPVYCEHANESPGQCTCPRWCYCRHNSCKNRDAQGFR